jgi:hypothetical protein
MSPRYGQLPAIQKFESHYIPEPNSGCWLWEAMDNGEGYGVISLNGKSILAHRWSYEYFVGPIPLGLDLDHKCRVRCCVNPNHVEPVTRQVNLLRGDTIPARNSRKTHCPKGHDYSLHGSNRLDTKGRTYRVCKLCRCEQELKFRRTGSY